MATRRAGYREVAGPARVGFLPFIDSLLCAGAAKRRDARVNREQMCSRRFPKCRRSIPVQSCVIW
jgi:hypothetical protein